MKTAIVSIQKKVDIEALCPECGAPKNITLNDDVKKCVEQCNECKERFIISRLN